MKIDTNHNSEYGNFTLIPEQGMKLYSFIDYESKLLIVSECPIDTSNLPSEHGIVLIPSTQFVVDTSKRKILESNEWKNYFKYETFETTTPDGKLKEIVRRIHEPDKNNDTINFSLFNLETNEFIYKNGSSVAFHEKPRESSIKRYYEFLESQKNYLKSLELGTYPDHKHLTYLNELRDGDIIIQYFTEKEVFELKFNGPNFELYKAPLPVHREQWESLNQVKVTSFNSLFAFWDYLKTQGKSIFGFMEQSPWYSTYTLRIKSRVIEKFIIEEHNKLVKNEIIPYNSYQELNNWMNLNYNEDLERNLLWQFCSHCRERVFYNPRYPNHACRKCVDKIIDNHGNKLDYRNTHELKYEENKFKLFLKENKNEVRIFIGEIEYFAAEARFGGIVHQLKE